MPELPNLLEALQRAPLTLLIPFISAFVGWFTNVVAVRMMFEPVEFVGLRPPLGWQGIVPANAIRLADTGLKLVTQRLLNIIEVFRDFDPEVFVEAEEDQLHALATRLVEETAAKRFPAMWEKMAPPIRQQMIAMVEAEVRKLSVDVLTDARDHIDELLDVQRIVHKALLADKALMGRIFQTVGTAEFVFIKRSGAYFGFAFGLVQLLVWLWFPAWWILPFFGFLVGYATNWVALRLIFEPREPRRYGPFVVHGLFHRRQKQIAVEFAAIMTRRILTPGNTFHELSTGSGREALLAMVRVRTDELIERYRKHPMAAPLFAAAGAGVVEADMQAMVERELFRPQGLLYAFADKSEEIRETLASRMAVMDAEAFENVLRPAFKADEWKLILAGAVLGLGAGIMQVVWLFGDALTR